MRRTKGFTLIEIIMSLGILVVGSVAVLGLYVQNMKLAMAARREVILAVMEKDIASKNQLAAFRANSQYTQDFADDTPASASGGGGWLVADYNSYNELVDTDTDFDDAVRYWPGPRAPDQTKTIDVYKGYYFAAYTLQRQGEFWSDHPDTHGLTLYDNQFTDWDGYGWIDLNGNGVDDGFSEDFGPPAPSHLLKYDSRKMGKYIKRVECVIGWDLNFDPDAFYTMVIRGINVGHNYQTFRFMLYNPDLNKF